MHNLITEVGFQKKISGHIIIFDSVDKCGALFTKDTTINLCKSKIPLLYEHNPRKRIGWIENLKQDLEGIIVDAIIVYNDKGCWKNKIVRQIENKTLTGLSIGYTDDDYETIYNDGKKTVKMKKITIWEISIVENPAEKKARIITL